MTVQSEGRAAGVDASGAPVEGPSGASGPSGAAVAGGVAPLARRARVAVLDSTRALPESLGSWIQRHAPDFELVLAVRSWLDLVQSANFPTDLVLMDVRMQESVSLRARVRTCRAAGARVIVLAGSDLEEGRRLAIEAGANGFASRSLPPSDLLVAARVVMTASLRATLDRAGLSLDDDGELALPDGGLPSASDDAALEWRPLPTGAEDRIRPKLSQGEMQALRLYVSGLSTSEVAARMNVQYETAKTYLRRVRDKYSRVGRPASRKAELARRAAEDGYLS